MTPEGLFSSGKLNYVGDTAPLPSTPEAAPAAEPQRRRFRRLRHAWRVVRPVVAFVAAVFAAMVVILAVIDIGQIKFRGQDIRSLIEKEGSKFLERPLHLGAFTGHLALGEFVLEDLRIEGQTADARPFFSAKRIAVTVPW